MGEARLVTVSERPQSEAAIIFVHGFGGDAEATWGEFPRLLKNQATGLSDWSIYSLGHLKVVGHSVLGGLRHEYKLVTKAA